MVAKARVAAPTGHRHLRHPLRQRHGLAAARSSRCSISQIKEGKPLTVTDPHMTRFMMSIDDAVDWCSMPSSMASPGDIFVQKAPAATIGTLARR